MAESCRMSIETSVERLFERRWMTVLLAVAIGLASAYLLGLKLEGAYYEYWVFPREKDDYIYPQLRYTIFDVVLLLWCISGLVFSVSSIRGAFTFRSLSRWPFRALLIYSACFVFLILGGILMLVARSRGY